MASIILLVFVCFLGTATCFIVDLTLSTSTPLDPDMTIHSPLTTGLGVCANQVVYRLDFTRHTKVCITLYFGNNITGFNYHVGDSIQNDGWAGDYGDTGNCAEIHAQDRTFLAYSNTLPGYQGESIDGALLHFQIANFSPINGVATFNISDETWQIDNLNGIRGIDKSLYYFKFRGQPPNYGQIENYLYVGLNRVVYLRSPRSGTGVCRAEIRWCP